MVHMCCIAALKASQTQAVCECCSVLVYTCICIHATICTQSHIMSVLWLHCLLCLLTVMVVIKHRRMCVCVIVSIIGLEGDHSV